MAIENLIAELKRRRVFRVLVGYGVVSFAVLQIVEPIMHGLRWPDAVLGYVVVGLAVGFPVSVVLAWAFDVNAGRIERAPEPAPGATGLRGSWLALVLFGIGVVAAAPGLAWYFLRGQTHEQPGTAAGAKGLPSIAVLPFADLSPNHDQEYFSDGIAMEILSALAHVEGLRVPGRSSSFWFKGKGIEPEEIGRKLRVTHLLEGTVRRAGTRLRITAEVIAVEGGDRLWSQTFDREQADVFAVQDEIARAVVDALRPKLLAGTTAPTSRQPNTNPETYRLFLLGRSLDIQGTKESFARATTALERAVELDPAYAPAQAWLSLAAGNLAQESRGVDRQRLNRQAREAAERAVSAGSDNADAYAVRASVRMAQWDWAGAEADLDRATVLGPNELTTLNIRALLLSRRGRYREAIASERRAGEAEPLDAIVSNNLATFLLLDGQLEEARRAARRSLEISPSYGSAHWNLGLLDLLSGNADSALKRFEQLEGARRLVGIAAAAHSLGREDRSRAALSELERDHADAPFLIANVRAWRGEPDGAFDLLERSYQAHDPDLGRMKTSPLLRGLHAKPRWAALLRKMNLPVDSESPAPGP